MEIDQNYLDAARYWGDSEPKNDKNQELKEFFDTLTEEEKEILDIDSEISYYYESIGLSMENKK